MGYSIGIGQHQIRKEVDEDETYIRNEVESEYHDDAPDNGMGDQENYRHPSYTGWYEFMEDAKLNPKMWIDEHPGMVHLSEKHLMQLNSVNAYDLEPINVERLEWLKFWTKWALKNCETPVVVNS